MSRTPKKYWEMNKTELAEATKEFDQEFIADKARPMTPTERKEEQRARRRGRPRVGKGAENSHYPGARIGEACGQGRPTEWLGPIGIYRQGAGRGDKPKGRLIVHRRRFDESFRGLSRLFYLMRIARPPPVDSAGDAHPNRPRQNGQDEKAGHEKRGGVDGAGAHPAVDDADLDGHQCPVNAAAAIQGMPLQIPIGWARRYMPQGAAMKAE